MPRVDLSLQRVKRAGQVTIPADIREAFSIEEGDYIRFKAVDNAIFLQVIDLTEIVRKPQK